MRKSPGDKLTVGFVVAVAVWTLVALPILYYPGPNLFLSFWHWATHDAVAVFTLVLAISTIGLWSATKRQIALARDEFISTHRPKLIVRQFQLEAPQPDHVLRVAFSIFNIGDTDATLRLVAFEVALWNGRFWEEPGVDRIVKPFGPKTIRNGQRASITVLSRFRITDAQIRAVRQSELAICAVGEFTYTDALGTERRTGFRRNYDFATDMFIASQNEDQEYQD